MIPLLALLAGFYFGFIVAAALSVGRDK